MFVKCALTSLSVFGIPLSAFLMQADQVQKPTRSQFWIGLIRSTLRSLPPERDCPGMAKRIGIWFIAPH